MEHKNTPPEIVVKNTGNMGKGRPRGARNKLLGAHGDLLTAWDRVSGPETAYRMMQVAVRESLAGNWEPIRTILPYIARKMPETVELIDATEHMTVDQLRAAAENVIRNLGKPD